MTLKMVGRCTDFAVLNRLFVPMFFLFRVAIKKERIVDCPLKVKTTNFVGHLGWVQAARYSVPPLRSSLVAIIAL